MSQEVNAEQIEPTVDTTNTDVETKDSDVKDEPNDIPTTFTEDDIAKKVQSETDKVRTEYSKKIKKLEERIAELEPKDLSPAELEMKRRLDELEEKQLEIQTKEELLNLQAKLSELNLPKSLVTFLQGNCDVGEFAKIVDLIVVERNKGLGYQPTPHINSDGMTSEKWAKLTYSQKLELYNTNPELYELFMKPKK